MQPMRTIYPGYPKGKQAIKGGGKKANRHTLQYADSSKKCSGPGGARTHDPHNAIVVRSQLRYRPRIYLIYLVTG